MAERKEKVSAVEPSQATAPRPTLVQVQANDRPWEEYGGLLIPGTEIYVAKVHVDATLAAKWLEHNDPEQRRVPGADVQRISGAIDRGAYVTTHQGICWGASRTIIDGQTRLRAVVASGSAIDVLVFWNLNARLKDPIDQTRRRTLAFQSNTSVHFVAVVGLLHQLETARLTRNIGDAQDQVLQTRERIEADYQLLHEICPMSSGYVAPLLYALPIDHDLIVNFARQIKTGEMLDAGDPAQTLRQWKERQRTTPPPRRIAMATMNCIRALLAHEKIEKVTESEVGYRAITTKRRVMKLPFTPSAEMVPGA